MTKNDQNQVPTNVLRYGSFGCLTGIGFILLLTSISCVPAGHVGVVTTFGKVSDDTVSEGVNLVAPWRSVKKMSLRTREDKEVASCPTREGLSIDLEVSILYSLNKDRAAEIYRTVGEDYEKVLVVPQFRAALRDTTTHYEAKDLYTANRDKIEQGLLKAVTATLAERGITCEGVYLRNIELPKAVRERIEAKLAADQDAQRMEFVLQKTKQEAEQRRVEAKGIADAQVIIKKDLDHAYLQYLWIEALKESAKHNNATIYVPTGGDGMPMFLRVKDSQK